jgi:hypothetical protein
MLRVLIEIAQGAAGANLVAETQHQELVSSARREQAVDRKSLLASKACNGVY